MSFFQRYQVAIILALIKFILAYLLQHPMYELHRDEMLYLAQGDHLAWGFMEVPPLLSIFAKITHLLGDSFYVVKLWPSLIGAATVFIAGVMATDMGGGKFAQLVAGLSIIASAYLRVHFLFQPNFLEIFFWTLAAFFIIRFINTKNSRLLYAITVSLAFGFLSKYSVAFFIAGIVVGLLFTKNRHVLFSKHLYFALLLALIIILPNLIWQYNHNWPVVTHMKELRETQLQFVEPADFLKGQLLMHLPAFFVWIGGLLWLLFSRVGRPYRIIGLMFVTVVALLTVTNGKDYYTLGAYPMIFAAGGVWLERLSAKRGTWLRYAAVLLIVILFLPTIPLALPVWPPAKLAAYYKRSGLDKTGFLRWEDLEEHPLPQDFADMISWRELGNKVSKVYASLPGPVKNNTVLYCRNYALAGAVKYYGKALPQVHSDNASFLLWMPDTYNIKHLLFVGRKMPEKGDIVFEQFAKATVLDSITTPMAREHGVKIILFENGNEKVNGMIEAGIKEMKNEFRRKKVE